MKKNIWLVGILIILGFAFYVFSRANYLFFHTTVESIVLIIGVLIFTISVISKNFNQSCLIEALGPGILVTSLITFMHVATFKGMNIIQGYDANLPTQLWIVLNYVLSVSVFIAILFGSKKVKFIWNIILFSSIGLIGTLLCFSGLFPTCFVEGEGLTVFKKVSEYIIIFIYLACLLLIYRKKSTFDNKTYITMKLFVFLLIVSEFMFTLYSDVYGIQNFLGHYFRVVAFLIIFIFIVVESIQKPYNSIFSELERLTRIDFLTNINNRRYFVELVENELIRNKRYNNSSAFLMIDIDHFKNINDKFGHSMGDEALKKVTEVCLETIRETDFMGRIGGEEFGVYLINTDFSEAILVAERIRKNVKIIEMKSDDGIILELSVSIGVTTPTSVDEKLDELMKRADKAMFKAKRLGRNKVASI